MTVHHGLDGSDTSPFHIAESDITSSWQGYLWALADRLRCVVNEDPQALDTLMAPSSGAQWLSPPVSDLVLVEEFLSTLRRHRFTDRQAAAAYPTFFWCVLGLLRVSTANATVAPPGGRRHTEPDVSPTVQRLRSSLSEDHAQEEYEDAVEALLGRLERSLAHDDS